MDTDSAVHVTGFSAFDWLTGLVLDTRETTRMDISIAHMTVWDFGSLFLLSCISYRSTSNNKTFKLPKVINS